MRVIDINGRLATAGGWAETEEAEAAAQARLRATRTGLRAMLAGNEAFHVDPMAAPAVSITPSVIGIDGAGPNGCTATVTYTRTGSTVRIDTVFTSTAPEPLNPHRIIDGAALIGAMNGPGDALVWVKREPEADTPAAPAAQDLAQPTRLGGHWYIHTGGQSVMSFACDAYGWISHAPTADAVCPVPDGVEFEARWYDGEVVKPVIQCAISCWRMEDELDAAFIAWRPIQS